ncbi:MAG: hypothetical protein N3C12_05900 [Candidatus Binatia bacterium]|nr:hypothetical protein [Candidatus Binatia bacterium]
MAWALTVLSVHPAQSLAGEACGYVAVRGTITATDLPQGRFRYRMPVVDG